MTTFTEREQARAAAWKTRTPLLPATARQAAPWIDHAGRPRGRYDHCLPPEHAAANLLPEAEGAIQLFAELGIPWHCGVGDGPGNNLLSSQVQCANALFAMVEDAELVRRAFGDVVDIAEVLSIEDGRYLTFEYIGPTDYFDEGRGKPRVRGSRCTSVDAAFRYRTGGGTTELALVEWKYTEQYGRLRDPNPGYDKTRIRRYGADFGDPNGPLRSDVLPIELMLDEPFYQLMRQQLLAHRLETDRAVGADVVRVLHVHPPENLEYQHSLVRAEHRELGEDVDAVWRRILRADDRFIAVDPARFLDPGVTSREYVDRYGAGSQPPSYSTDGALSSPAVLRP
ncbi:PGN_0703 family putative restriction endonuclease [Nocardioides sp. CPCC 205120]|uniref:PGN_0703 family putative restriction endonuclease n=1 Tax=Nocardioides sp. CPCC 205120 TaxID=3406462 RepID=UPI003B51250C